LDSESDKKQKGKGEERAIQKNKRQNKRKGEKRGRSQREEKGNTGEKKSNTKRKGKGEKKANEEKRKKKRKKKTKKRVRSRTNEIGNVSKKKKKSNTEKKIQFFRQMADRLPDGENGEFKFNFRQNLFNIDVVRRNFLGCVVMLESGILARNFKAAAGVLLALERHYPAISSDYFDALLEMTRRLRPENFRTLCARLESTVYMPARACSMETVYTYLKDENTIQEGVDYLKSNIGKSHLTNVPEAHCLLGIAQYLEALKAHRRNLRRKDSAVKKKKEKRIRRMVASSLRSFETCYSVIEKLEEEAKKNTEEINWLHWKQSVKLVLQAVPIGLLLHYVAEILQGKIKVRIKTKKAAKVLFEKIADVDKAVESQDILALRIMLTVSRVPRNMTDQRSELSESDSDNMATSSSMTTLSNSTLNATRIAQHILEIDPTNKEALEKLYPKRMENARDFRAILSRIKALCECLDVDYSIPDGTGLNDMWINLLDTLNDIQDISPVDIRGAANASALISSSLVDHKERLEWWARSSWHLLPDTSSKRSDSSLSAQKRRFLEVYTKFISWLQECSSESINE